MVKQSINPVTGEIKEYPIQERGRVISEETASNVLSMMESVVGKGTGKNAQVKGYLVGGKTGTSEDGVNTNKYVTSFCGVAPISDPQVVILITLYNPTGEGGHQGGGVAAPIASQVLTDVLEYLEVKKDNIGEADVIEEVEVPELRGETLKSARKKLKDLGLELSTNNSSEEETEELQVKDQTPKVRNKGK